MHGTQDPLLIMIINMAIVFAVLFGLSLVIRVIKYINDIVYEPKKTAAEGTATVVKPAQAPASPVPVAVPAAAPLDMENKTLVAVITTAIMAYGYKDVKIRSITKKA